LLSITEKRAHQHEQRFNRLMSVMIPHQMALFALVLNCSPASRTRIRFGERNKMGCLLWGGDAAEFAATPVALQSSYFSLIPA